MSGRLLPGLNVSHELIVAVEENRLCSNYSPSLYRVVLKGGGGGREGGRGEGGRRVRDGGRHQLSMYVNVKCRSYIHSHGEVDFSPDKLAVMECPQTRQCGHC